MGKRRKRSFQFFLNYSQHVRAKKEKEKKTEEHIFSIFHPWPCGVKGEHAGGRGNHGDRHSAHGGGNGSDGGNHGVHGGSYGAHGGGHGVAMPRMLPRIVKASLVSVA